MENTPSVFTTLFCVITIFFLFSMVFFSASIRIIPEYKRLSVYRLGRYIGEKGPGVVLLLPFIDKAITKDLSEASPTPSRRLVGALGETQTTVFTDGKVLLSNSEVWDAVSQKPISVGQRVHVVRVILEVEQE
jgi:regulator of protease activity HflC (stomatin/prohibitin superfamily)